MRVVSHLERLWLRKEDVDLGVIRFYGLMAVLPFVLGVYLHASLVLLSSSLHYRLVLAVYLVLAIGFTSQHSCD